MKQQIALKDCPADIEMISHMMLSRQKAAELSSRMKLLSHPTRIQILKILTEGDQCVCVFSKALKKRQPNISQHLSKLKDGGFIESYMRGKYAYYTLKEKGVARLMASL